MKDRTGWTRGAAGPQQIGQKRYRNLVEFTRACATCNSPFSIFVTEKIADGEADSNNFGLKNCERHRRSGPGGVPEELDALRSKDKTMSDELKGMLALNRELAARVRELEAKLALHELKPQRYTEAGFPWA